jgi:hypothetical protein
VDVSIHQVGDKKILNTKEREGHFSTIAVKKNVDKIDLLNQTLEISRSLVISQSNANTAMKQT